MYALRCTLPCVKKFIPALLTDQLIILQTNPQPCCGLQTDAYLIVGDGHEGFLDT